MTTALLFNGLWMLVICAQTCLLVELAVKKALRAYPAFSTFIAFCVARSLVLLYVSQQHADLYQPIKWIAYVPQLAVLIAVVLEVLYLLFHPFEALPARTMAHFAQATTIVGAVAIGFAILHPGAQPTAWLTFARAMDQVVSWILCSVFVFFGLFAKYFGIPARHRVYGIGLGFTLYLTVDVAVTTIVAQLRLPPLSPVWLLDMVAFLGACVIWICYFRVPEVPRSVPSYEQIEKVRAILGDFGKFLQDAGLHDSRHNRR